MAKPPQHDAHVDAYDNYLVGAAWKAAVDRDADKMLSTLENVKYDEPTNLYVIGRTFSDENVYWSNKMGWVNLSEADEFEISAVKENKLPIDGYWLPLEMAYEREL